MTAAAFRSYLRAVSFRPLTITMAGGQTFRVEHPELALPSSNNHDLVIDIPGEGPRLLNLLLVQEVRADAPPAPSEANGE